MSAECYVCVLRFSFFFQAEDCIRDYKVTGVQTCALPIYVEVVRLFAIAACIPAILAAQDAKEIVRSAVQVNDRNEEISRNYTYLERQDLRVLDGSGRVKDRKIQTWDITLLEGSPYRRLVARDDKPLPPAEQKKEEEKLRKK